MGRLSYVIGNWIMNTIIALAVCGNILTYLSYSENWINLIDIIKIIIKYAWVNLRFVQLIR